MNAKQYGNLPTTLALATAVLVGLLGTGTLSSLPAQTKDEVKVAAGPPAQAKVQPVAKEGLVPTSNLWDIMQKGGVLMWPLAFCSVIGLGFVFERLICLRRSRVIPRAFVRLFLRQLREGTLDRAAALEFCEDSPSPMATVFAAAVRKWGRPSLEIEQAVVDAGDRATNGLRRYLRIFTALTVISPLLGLLGTVFGMIKSFNAVATSEALGRPEMLAEGISQALLNTAFGLSIAIPAQSFYYFFVSRVDRLIIEMDARAQEVINLISAEETGGREQAPPLPPPVVRPRRLAARESDS